jgi:Icc-related predicted phosphoesterase
MKIAVCSDLHLEFGAIELDNKDGADVLVLSGDICVVADLRAPDPYSIMNTERMDRFFKLFDSASQNFKHVIYIMGNHEHYHGDFAESANTLRRFLKAYDNVHFLDKESVTIEDTTFIGGTLWTNFDQGYGPGDDMAMRVIQGMMNDYRGVQNSAKTTWYNVPHYKMTGEGDYVRNDKGEFILERNEKKSRPSMFTPQDSYEDHCAMMEFIRGEIKDKRDDRFVICGHHAPSKLSTHPRYKDQVVMNTAYSSDLSNFILDNPQIKMWTHGHTHEDFDYMLGSTRIVCNPRGYINYEHRASAFQLKTFEV